MLRTGEISVKKIKTLAPDRFLRLLFLGFSLAFFLAAVCMPDRGNIFTGLKNIALLPAKTPTNYFDSYYGGYAGTFFNAGLVCLICTLLFFLPGAKANGASVIAFLLTAGFSFWGINVLNLWFGFFGVALFCLCKRQRLGAQVNAMIFTTGLAPLFSDLLCYYPFGDYMGLRWQGFAVALAAGLVVGFFLAMGLGHAANCHKGFSIYSAALPMGLLAFFLRGGLYGVLGGARGTTATGQISDLSVSSSMVANVFCLAVFLLCIVGALAMGCRAGDYGKLLRDPGHKVDFSQKYGTAATLMNVGVFGLFILAYYNLVALISGSDVVFNAVTFGCIFCMLATCCSGSHPVNVWPILVGYAVASFACRYLSMGLLGMESFSLTLDAQAILVGVCFANGLSPVAGKYGWGWGIFAGACHFALVTSVPLLQGGFLLYNGGLTACLVSMLLVPVMESFQKEK